MQGLQETTEQQPQISGSASAQNANIGSGSGGDTHQIAAFNPKECDDLPHSSQSDEIGEIARSLASTSNHRKDDGIDQSRNDVSQEDREGQLREDLNEEAKGDANEISGEDKQDMHTDELLYVARVDQ